MLEKVLDTIGDALCVCPRLTLDLFTIITFHLYFIFFTILIFSFYSLYKYRGTYIEVKGQLCGSSLSFHLNMDGL